jgi:uncharacterized Rmd1/YagE family protein
MSKEERERHGYNRLTAYSVAEGYRAKAVAPFLKREHGVKPRVFDEAMYAVSFRILDPSTNVNVNQSPRRTTCRYCQAIRQMLTCVHQQRQSPPVSL